MTLLAESPTLTASRILVVEDDAGVRMTVRDILESEGCQVRTAAGALEALQDVRAHPPELIVSDINMPQHDGFELLAQLRAQSELIDIPVIFLTARASPEDVRRGMEQGADDYLVKPFDPEALVRAVRTRLKRRRALEAGVSRFRESVAQMLPHELRTPLVGVLGFSELLMREARDAGPHGLIAAETVRDRARYIHQSGKRLHELVERYTLWVELNTQADALISRRSEWHNEDVVSIMVERVRAHANERGRLKDLQIALQPAALAVPDSYLPAIVVQLVDNALKFSNPGQAVAITGSAHGDHYTVRVRDVGRGIPAGALERVTSFRQFDRDQFEQQGVGLGLSIAQKFAQIVHGELRIESNPAGGDTQVSLRVPLAASL